ncbi:hypothetical protein U9M48_045068 [Paspalum notatum var. saurae]|uniref:Regulatory particle non-ATPase 13 n=1 Tax=Paspalum notatum var. saurae TaxID=547442 RepID=A0AAQ3UWB9_PASNO
MESPEPLQFRAGKMSLEGTRVVPDTRNYARGLSVLGEEGLVHFQWLDRGQNIVEDDQIVFPDEAIFEKVTESSGRVYILKFKHDSRKFFFWMQEPNADRDTQICIQINDYINRPLDADADLAVPIEAEMSEDTADDDISSRAGNLVDQSMTADLACEVTSAAGPVRLEDLQRILSAIQPSSGGAADPDAERSPGGTKSPHLNILPMYSGKAGVWYRTSKAKDGSSRARLLPIPVWSILKPELVLPLNDSLPIEQLASHLPEGSWTPNDIIELLQSAPLRQQLDAFTHVLRSGQIDLAQFGVDPSKHEHTVVSFLEALEESVGKASSSAGDKDGEAQQGGGSSDPMDES